MWKNPPFFSTVWKKVFHTVENFPEPDNKPAPPSVVCHGSPLKTKPAMDNEDAILLAAYRDGDAEALGRLVEKYKRPLFGFLSRFAARPGEADEWFQETWVRAIRHMNLFRQKNLLSWLFRIAHNLVIDQARRRKPDCSLDAPHPETGRPLSDHVPAESLSPALEAAGRDLGRHIEAAANLLPVEQREVFWLRMAADLPFKEIARIQRCSVNTALGRMQYAIAKLRAALGPAYRELQEIRP